MFVELDVPDAFGDEATEIPAGSFQAGGESAGGGFWGGISKFLTGALKTVEEAAVVVPKVNESLAKIRGDKPDPEKRFWEMGMIAPNKSAGDVPPPSTWPGMPTMRERAELGRLDIIGMREPIGFATIGIGTVLLVVGGIAAFMYFRK